MKAGTLLTLLKKCVLCLFLCVLVKDGVAQQIDSSLISLAVTNQIVEHAKSYDSIYKGIKISGDSSIIRYIPAYYREEKADPDRSLFLEGLHTKVNGKYLSVDFISRIMYTDHGTGFLHQYTVDTDSLRKNYVVQVYSEEESFWDDALQPILVTAGAAAVIALFFFVKF